MTQCEAFQSTPEHNRSLGSELRLSLFILKWHKAVKKREADI